MPKIGRVFVMLSVKKNGEVSRTVVGLMPEVCDTAASQELP